LRESLREKDKEREEMELHVSEANMFVEVDVENPLSATEASVIVVDENLANRTEVAEKGF
jgi:hypothetical protein